MKERKIKCQIPIFGMLTFREAAHGFSSNSHNLASAEEVENYAVENDLAVNYVRDLYEKLNREEDTSNFTSNRSYLETVDVLEDISNIITELFYTYLEHYGLKGKRSVYILFVPDCLPTKEITIEPKDAFNPHDNYHIRVPLDFQNFMNLAILEKKKEVLRLMMLAITCICEQYGWPFAPFEEVAMKIKEVGYRCEYRIARAKSIGKHPTRKLKAGFGVIRDVGQSELFLFISDDKLNELHRANIAKDVNLDWEFSRYSRYVGHTPIWLNESEVMLGTDKIKIKVPASVLKEALLRPIKAQIADTDDPLLKQRILDIKLFQSYRYSDDTQQKFWRIRVENGEVLLNYGKEGTAGRFEFKEIPLTEKFELQIKKLIQTTVKKGYVLDEKKTANLCQFFDVKGRALHPLTTHPKFLEHFNATFYLDAKDSSSPFVLKYNVGLKILESTEVDYRKNYKLLHSKSPTFNPSRFRPAFGLAGRCVDFPLMTSLLKKDRARTTRWAHEPEREVIEAKINTKCSQEVIEYWKGMSEPDWIPFVFSFIKITGCLPSEWKEKALKALNQDITLKEAIGKPYQKEKINQMIEDLLTFDA